MGELRGEREERGQLSGGLRSSSSPVPYSALFTRRFFASRYSSSQGAWSQIRFNKDHLQKYLRMH